MLRRRPDGSFDLKLDDHLREVAVALLRDLAEGIDAAPDHPDLQRLRPPAYLDDAERDAAYQLLAGEELRTARREAIDGSIAALGKDRLTEAELWALLQALNGVRLVVGTRLDISEDDQGEPGDEGTLSDEERSLWAIYQFTTAVQHEVVEALSD